MIDSQIIAFVVIMAGAVCGVIVPYLFKVMEDGRKFDKSYLWGLVLSLVVAAFAVLPDTIEIAFKPLFGLFLAGLGLETIATSINAKRIKSVK
jgi:O-antigen/teichoic acid export membrane protein